MILGCSLSRRLEAERLSQTVSSDELLVRDVLSQRMPHSIPYVGQAREGPCCIAEVVDERYLFAARQVRVYASIGHSLRRVRVLAHGLGELGHEPREQPVPGRLLSCKARALPLQESVEQDDSLGLGSHGVVAVIIHVVAVFIIVRIIGGDPPKKPVLAFCLYEATLRNTQRVYLQDEIPISRGNTNENENYSPRFSSQWSRSAPCVL